MKKLGQELVIIDGPSVLTACFYGQTPEGFAIAQTDEERAKFHKDMLRTSDGRFINAVYGMTKYLLKVFKQVGPSHIVITWDTTRDTFRRLIYPDYKGNRSKTPYELSSQFPIMKDFLTRLGIIQLENDRNEKDMKKLVESDDIIGTLAKMFQDDIFVSIISKDRDMLQLVTEMTSVLLMTKKAYQLKEKYQIANVKLSGTFQFTPEIVESELGVLPCQVIDLKALLGDKSDNIPGVKNVGETSAPQLIKEYGNIENLYDTIRHFNELDNLTEKADIKNLKKEIKEIKDFWKNDLGIKKSPINALIKLPTYADDIVGEKAALLSKELATIKTDIPIDYTLEDFKFVLDENKLNELMKELEFYSLVDSTEDDPIPIMPNEPQQQKLFS